MSDIISEPLKLNDIPIVSNKELKRVIFASGLGNAIEWFDFGIYGFLAIILGKAFFSMAPESFQIIASLATFSIPFFFRPLGGAIFGHLGDKYGRKHILSFTIILMSISTFCIGIIPSYQTIGILAPILLLLAKIVQGLSVGGEYAGAAIFVAEYSPDRKRGFMASWLDWGSIFGFLAGAGIVSLLPALMGEQAFHDWGWRIPFILSLPLGFIGLYLRKALDESPTFTAQITTGRDRQSTPMQILQHNWKNIILCCCLVIVMNSTYYMLLTYLPSYLSLNLNYSYSHSVAILIFVMTFMLFIQPFIGYMSDRIGRKPFIIGGAFALFLFSYPAFWMINHDNIWCITIGLAILSVILCNFTGVTAAILPALFPAEVRFRTLAIAFNISILIAGITPPLTAWLVAATGSLYIPAWYLMTVALFGIFVGIIIHETANKPLKDSVPVASSSAEAKEVLQEHFERIEERVGVIDEKINELQEKRQELVDQHPKLT